MSYKQNCENCFDDRVGESGLSKQFFEKFLLKTHESIEKIKDRTFEGVQPVLDSVFETGDIDILEDVAERFCESFDDVVVLGTGGSSLGGKMLSSLYVNPITNISNGYMVQPRLYFLENIDYVSFESLFEQLNLSRTGFIAISKSGSTIETLVQFLFAIDRFKSELGAGSLNKHFISLTESGDRPLRTISDDCNIPVFNVSSTVGGRYSGFSLSSLLPAMISGVDGLAVREGAASVVSSVLDRTDVMQIEPAVGAAISVGLAQQKQVVANILMPYLDRLENFGKWYRQLWAESTGKLGQGTIPVNALGTVDQHSQLQLYLEGPANKFFTLIISDVSGKGGQLPSDLIGNSSVEYLAGKKIGDIMVAEQRATIETLIKSGKPLRYLEIPSLDEYTLGELMMHFMLETIISANIMSVNPFDQPAVEEGKALARKFILEEKL